MNNISRRHRLDLMEPAELAIVNAVGEVEKMPADVRLTNAVILLEKARNLVADFIDGIPKESSEGKGEDIELHKLIEFVGRKFNVGFTERDITFWGNAEYYGKHFGTDEVLRAFRELPSTSPQPTYQGMKDELIPLPEPIGDFILEQPDIYGSQTANGKFYHYADVCTLLNRYVQQFRTAQPTEGDLKTRPYTYEQLGNMLEDVVNVLDLSDSMIDKHGPLGTAPAELVRSVLEQKNLVIKLLKSGLKEVPHERTKSTSGPTGMRWVKASEYPKKAGEYYCIFEDIENSLEQIKDTCDFDLKDKWIGYNKGTWKLIYWLDESNLSGEPTEEKRDFEIDVLLQWIRHRDLGDEIDREMHRHINAHKFEEASEARDRKYANTDTLMKLWESVKEIQKKYSNTMDNKS